MYTYNVKNLSEPAIKAVMRNLMKDYCEEDARKLMIEKYPYLEGDIINISATDDDTPVASSPEPVVFETIDDTFDEEAEIDVKDLIDDTEQLIDAVEAVVEETKKPTKAVKPAKTSTARKDSKAARAREIYMNATDKSRKAIVALFVSELDMTSTAAGAYYYSTKAKCGE